MIILITGQPRHGKSQYAVSRIFDYLEKNNKLADKGGEPLPIYTDINGINEPDTITKLDGVFKVPDKKFWFAHEEECPEGYSMPEAGSIFIFDECHKLDWVKSDRGSISKNPTTISLNEHGHFDYIIIFMTQFPKYIHPHIQGLIETHIHVKRPHGASFAWLYEFDEYVANPRTESAFKNAVSKKRFKYQDKFQNAYKSSSSHNTMRFRLPGKLVIPGIFFLILIALLVFRFFHSPIGDQIRGVDKSKTVTTKTVNSSSVSHNSFDSAVSNFSNVQSNQVLHNPALNKKYLPSYINEVAYFEDVRPAMIIKHIDDDGKITCRSLNYRGEALRVPHRKCLSMSERTSLIPRSRIKHDLPNQIKMQNIKSNQDFLAHDNSFSNPNH